MGQLPAKRRRRVVISSSEDEENDSIPPARTGHQPGNHETKSASRGIDRKLSNARILPSRPRSNQQPASNAPQVAPARWSPPTTPKKKPKSKSTTVRKSVKPTALDTFCSAKGTTQITGQSVTQKAEHGTPVEGVDLIEDDSFDEELRRLSYPRMVAGGRARDTPPPSEFSTEKGGSNKLPTGSQIFRKLGHEVQQLDNGEKAARSREDDTRPWADRYGPTSVEELAVHKKKVSDVKDWLDAVCYRGSKKKLLILKGASGVGKTATISTLASAMDLDVLRWQNPTVSDFSSDTYVSTSAQFEDFLGRSGKFASLQVTGGEDGSTSNGLPLPSKAYSGCKKMIVLIEEFPNISMSSSTPLQLFRASVLRYLATNPAYMNGTRPNAHASGDSTMPLVMIITETQVNSVTSVGEGFTAHRLLGADILSHPSTDVIEFNSIAPTYITKALNLVIQKEARDSGRRRVPGPSVLSRLSQVGDVRSAIASLEFLCLKSQNDEDWGGRVASKGRKGPKNAAALTKMEEKSLKLVTQREASLGLFHAVGKVVYNKREGPGEGNFPVGPFPQPPDHLPHHVRLRPPDVSINDLANETGTDTQTFIAALHENYVLSCAGDDFTDTLNACTECLSDTDLLVPGKAGTYRGTFTFQSAATESLRQDEIAFQVAVRGLLFGLPCPVKRTGHPQGTAGRSGKGDAFKMFYPTSMRLRAQTMEVEEMVERWMRRWDGGDASTALPGGGTWDGNREDGVFAWAQRTLKPQYGHGGADSKGAATTPSKDAMVLETLPYWALVERHRPGSVLVEELNRVTRVTGEVTLATEESPDESDTRAPMGEGPTPTTVTNARGIAPKAAAIPPTRATAIEQAVSHLYLSEDDIED